MKDKIRLKTKRIPREFQDSIFMHLHCIVEVLKTDPVFTHIEIMTGLIVYVTNDEMPVNFGIYQVIEEYPNVRKLCSDNADVYNNLFGRVGYSFEENELFFKKTIKEREDLKLVKYFSRTKLGEVEND